MSTWGQAKGTNDGHTVCLNSERGKSGLLTAHYDMLYTSTLENIPSNDNHEIWLEVICVEVVRPWERTKFNGYCVCPF